MTSQPPADDVENPPHEKTPLLEDDSRDDSITRNMSTGIGSRIAGTVGAVGGSAKFLAAGTGNVAKRLGEGLANGYSTSVSRYDKLFLKHVNPAFGDALEVASRGACFVVICALPFILPKELCPRCEELIASDYYTATCIVYFVYTLYLHTGDTIHFAQGGIGGTMMAVINCWLMQGFMPGGYHAGEDLRWWTGNVLGMLFVIAVLWLNFDDITRIFALSTFVWYWMAFLEPGFNWGFARNFQVRFDGVAFRELLVATIGCVIAVVAGFVPYPMYAHAKALSASKAMTEQIYMAKKDFLKYYSGDHPDEMAVKVLSAELEAIREHVLKIPGLLDSAWYESFGKKKWIVQRKLIARFRQYVASTCDRLANVLNICEGETFDDAHIALMESIQEPMDRIVDHNAEILQVCVDILLEGRCHPEWEAKAEEHIVLAIKAVVDLTEKFKEERTAIAIQHKEQQEVAGVSEDEIVQEIVGSSIAGENVVGITLCKFTEITRDFYGNLRDISNGKVEERHSWKKGDGILGIFEPDVLKNIDHLMWVMRNGMAIILTFYIGLHGYNKYIKSYNANIAGTVSVLLSNFAGSAALKNLARLQGVVIGIVLGNLLYALLGWCAWWGHLLVGVVLYFWSLLGLFMYYHSEAYSTVGLLLVVFGAKSLLRRCSSELTEPVGYRNIVDVTVAVVVMTLVDTLLSPARASDLARKAFHKAHAPLLDALTKLFDPEDVQVRRQEGAIMALIKNAESLGKEAALEPRFWRCDWPTTSFDVAVKCLGSMRFSMNSMEINVLHYVNGKRLKKKEFLRAITLDSFRKPHGVRDLLLEHMKSVMKSVETSLSDNGAHDIFQTRLKVLEQLDQTTVRWSDALEEFSMELNKTIPKVHISPREQSLSEDAYADVCMVVESLKSMFTELDTVLRTLSATIGQVGGK